MGQRDMPKIDSKQLSVVQPKLEGYAYFMQNEPQKNLGPIHTEQDEIFGKQVKVRDVSIAMMRNASTANRKQVKVFLEPFPHIRIEKAKELQGWYKGANERNQVRPRPCWTEALLTQPYGGFCPNSCLFCYIDSGMRGYRATGLMTVPINYGEQIRQQLKKIRRGSAGYFTSFHDPFNPLEKIYHNSQQAAEAFIEVGLPIFFLSRLRYPDWAIDLLTRNKYSYAQKSINTSDADDWHKLSPGVPPLATQLEDIRRLKSADVYVSVQVNPIVPGVTSNQQIVELFRMLAEVGANHVIVKFVEAAYSWAPTMIQKMVDAFGDRGRRFGELFTQNIGGEKTVDEDYRMRAHKVFTSYAKRYGLTYGTCYEYRWERNESGGIVNKTGISIGPEVTTGAQCHGQRVPMFTRNRADEIFREVSVCPPSGCLYCSENNGGTPRCGDVLAGEAAALRMADLKKPIGLPK
jgi:DNA repair photolyase